MKDEKADMDRLQASDVEIVYKTVQADKPTNLWL